MNGSPAHPPSAADPLRPAMAALKAGRHDEAAALFGRLAAAEPLDPRPALGLVRTLIARGQPADAIAQLSASQHLAHRAPIEWDALLGHALHRVGDLDRAEAAFLRVLREAPGHRQARIEMFHILRYREQRDEAVALIDAAPPGLGPDLTAVLLVLKLGVLVDLWRAGEARMLHEAAVERATTLSELTSLFGPTSRIHGDNAPRVFARMLERLAHLPGGTPAKVGLLTARLHLALDDRDGFLAAARPVLDAEEGGPLTRHLHTAHDALTETADQARRRERVFVIGLSRTGTSSLHQALAELGYGSAHWANPITNRMLSVKDMALFGAVSDIPVTDAMEDLAVRYPEARFVLSERPLDIWRPSVERHYRRHHGTSDVAILRDRLDRHNEVPWGTPWRRLHENIYTQHADFAAAHAAHQARVARCFADAPGRLLRFDVTAGDGWEKLCGFLQRPRPQMAFPHLNAG